MDQQQNDIIATYFKLFTQALDAKADPAQLQNARKIFYAGAGAAIATFRQLNNKMQDDSIAYEQAEAIFEGMEAEIAEFNKRIANGSA